MQDQPILQQIKSTLGARGIELLIAEHEKDLRNSISEKIKRMIDSSHVGLVLLTKNGINSGFVREEIGYMVAKGKPCLLVFEQGVRKEYGGFKYGYDYIELDSSSPQTTIDKVRDILMKHWKKRYQAQQERKRKKAQNNAIVGLGVLAALLIMNSGE